MGAAKAVETPAGKTEEVHSASGMYTFQSAEK